MNKNDQVCLVWRKSCSPGVQGCPRAFQGVGFGTSLTPCPKPWVTPLPVDHKNHTRTNYPPDFPARRWIKTLWCCDFHHSKKQTFLFGIWNQKTKIFLLSGQGKLPCGPCRNHFQEFFANFLIPDAEPPTKSDQTEKHLFSQNVMTEVCSPTTK